MDKSHPKTKLSKTKLSEEEIFNIVTHGIGLILASIGFTFLVVTVRMSDIAAMAIYGATLVLLYLASTVYHASTSAKAKTLFRKLDHIGIFFLIAGTYTPFCLIALDNTTGSVLLAAVWTLAVAGLIFKIFLTGKYEWLSLLLYLSMGWLVVLVLKPVYEATPLSSFLFLLIGGLFYSSGVIFYRMSRLKYHHGIWHLFVVAGSASHFVAVYLLL